MKARSRFLLFAAALAAVSPSVAETGGARNVIVMVADGAGFNSWVAASMYSGTRGSEIYDGDDWVRLAASVHSLRGGSAVGVGAQHANTRFPNRVYDPAKAWDTTPLSDGKGNLRFAGYRWLSESSPDSASTASAIANGHKSYDGAINVDGAGKPLEPTLARLARDGGRRVGVVTSVLLPHATPAAFGGAHNKSRRNYCEIAVDLLTMGLVDVLAGVGHPDFDHNGDAIDDPARRNYTFVGGRNVWDTLTGTHPLPAGAGVCRSAGAVAESQAADHATAEAAASGKSLSAEQVRRLRRWTLRQSHEEIAALRDGATPQQLLLLPQVGSLGFWPGRSTDAKDPYPARRGGTLQQQRGSRANPRQTPPGFDPPTATVPTLETLTQVALNALDDGDEGFFLHVEGGAVDWAMHANQMGRMIEELTDFKAAVRAVVEWVDAADAWDDTLLVVTADHDHMLWGPEADKKPFQPLQDRGAGKLPAYRWLTTGHSNALVPVFARGAGAEALREAADREDPFRGPYLDQTDIFKVLASAITGSSPP